MTKPEKFVDAICKKTMAGSVDWQATTNSAAFQAILGKFVVRLEQRIQADGESDDYYLHIHNQDGDRIDSFSDLQLDGEAQSVNLWYKVMKRAYESARRNAMGGDAAIDSILEALETDDDS